MASPASCCVHIAGDLPVFASTQSIVTFTCARRSRLGLVPAFTTACMAAVSFGDSVPASCCRVVSRS